MRGHRQTGGFFDPIALAAPVAWLAAPESCAIDPATGVRCDWYHGLWPYLRLLGVNNTLARQAPLFIEALGLLAQTGRHHRVLVSGTADHLMASIVLKAYRDAGAALDLTVLDRCETPLMLSRWYADRVGDDLKTVRSSILDFIAGSPFDVICAHSFFYHFEPCQWPALIAAWHDALRPGGSVLIANNIRPSAPEGPISFAADEADRLRDRVLTEAARRRGELDIDEAALARALDTYIANFTLHYKVIRSRGELTNLFSAGGFSIEQATFSSLRREAAIHAPFGSEVERENAWIVARRD